MRNRSWSFWLLALLVLVAVALGSFALGDSGLRLHAETLPRGIIMITPTPDEGASIVADAAAKATALVAAAEVEANTLRVTQTPGGQATLAVEQTVAAVTSTLAASTRTQAAELNAAVTATDPTAAGDAVAPTPTTQAAAEQNNPITILLLEGDREIIEEAQVQLPRYISGAVVLGVSSCPELLQLDPQGADPVEFVLLDQIVSTSPFASAEERTTGAECRASLPSSWEDVLFVGHTGDPTTDIPAFKQVGVDTVLRKRDWEAIASYIEANLPR